ncbi:hypothetical protein NHX12_014830 [Muraenolepis orangiensis]|uniref:Reverse transcriptase domain-containing protein n=1 Tax=Muraenolepis orangiensis TaxID=630683 RepID=A0A9Q0I3W1_9TELE|nr:hypothetical protein NHX12_014830 [Muraenolepis orangiensis]
MNDTVSLYRLVAVLYLLTASNVRLSSSSSSGDLTVEYGEDASFVCALADPSAAAGVVQVTLGKERRTGGTLESVATYSKRFGGQMDDPYRDKVRWTASESVAAPNVTVRNATWADEGCYVCTFSVFPTGSQSSRRCLTVIGISNVTTVVRQTGPRELVVSCSTMGRPPPVLRWEAGSGGNLSGGSVSTQDNTDGTVTVSSELKLNDAALTTLGNSVDCLVYVGGGGSAGPPQRRIAVPLLSAGGDDEEEEAARFHGGIMVAVILAVVILVAGAIVFKGVAVGNLRQGKSPGHDNIHPEFVTHQSETTSAWLCSFFSSCFQRSKLPKTWRRAAVIALLKPGKTAEDPKAYRPISLLCVPFQILERMILSRIEPVVDPQLPREQAGFRRGRSTVDQVTLLTQDIEDSFQAKEKVGVVLLDLTAAYDTVWHRGLHLKLLRTIPDRHMVKFIMEMLSNRSFILRTSDGQRSRLRRLRNGVPQGSVLSPLLFNIYIHDLPETTSRQYGYADDLAIMLRRTTWSAVEQGLNQDMGILAAYLRKWRLQLSTGKTVSAAYHLCNREAKREPLPSVFGWTGHCPTNSSLRK